MYLYNILYTEFVASVWLVEYSKVSNPQRQRLIIRVNIFSTLGVKRKIVLRVFFGGFEITKRLYINEMINKKICFCEFWLIKINVHRVSTSFNMISGNMVRTLSCVVLKPSHSNRKELMQFGYFHMLFSRTGMNIYAGRRHIYRLCRSKMTISNNLNFCMLTKYVIFSWPPKISKS
jgi:hypothetical protein